MVEGSLPPKFRIRSCLADSEAALPPSKRRFRAFEAMSACAAEAAAEEELQQQQACRAGGDDQQAEKDAGESPAAAAATAAPEPEITKACVVDDVEKLREFVDKEVDPVSVSVSQAPGEDLPGSEPTQAQEETKMNGVCSPTADAEEGELPPESPETSGEEKIEKQPYEGEQGVLPEIAPVQDREEESGATAEQACNSQQGKNMAIKSSSSPELSPVSMEMSDENNNSNEDRVAAAEQSDLTSSKVEEQQEQQQQQQPGGEAQDAVENIEAQNQVTQAEAAPEAQETGRIIEAKVIESEAQPELKLDNNNVNEAEAPAALVATAAAAAVPTLSFERSRDSLVQMELRPSLYKYRRRGKPPSTDAATPVVPPPVDEPSKPSSSSPIAASPPPLSKLPPVSPADAGKGKRTALVPRAFSRSPVAANSPLGKFSPVSPTDDGKAQASKKTTTPIKGENLEAPARVTPKLSPVSFKGGKSSEELPSPGAKVQKPRSARGKRPSPASKNGSVSERGTTESHSGESLASEGVMKAEITSSRTKVVVHQEVSLSSLKHPEVPVNKVREAIEAANKLKQKLALKEGETSSSMKYIMAACQSKQIPGGSVMMFEDAADAGTRDFSPVGTDAEAAKEAFKGLLDVLSRAKESILRATRQAIDCAKLGLSEQVIDIIAKRLEMEQSFPRRIDLFFLVDSITQWSHNVKGTPAGVYRAIVQNALPRLLSAAAPPGSFARENRRQCLKVFKLWHERGVFPPPVIRHFMHEIELHNCDRMVMNMSRRPARNERPVDDPIRDMEGMQVDEYGSNASFSLPGLNIPRMFDDDEEANEKPETDSEPNPAPSAATTSTPPPEPAASDRHRRVLEEVDGELEMEDVSPENETWQRQYVSPASILAGPPLPVCSPPPLPASPPPPPPPPPGSPPPAPPGAGAPGFPYPQDGYGGYQEGYMQDGGFSPGFHHQQHVQNSSSIPQGYSIEQYNPAMYDDGYGARGEAAYSSYGMPAAFPPEGPAGFAPPPPDGHPGGAFTAEVHPRGFAPPPPEGPGAYAPEGYHEGGGGEQEFYGPPPPVPPHEQWHEASPPPPPPPPPQTSRGRYRSGPPPPPPPGEFYNSEHDRYGEHSGGGRSDYYHHQHHHQNGPHHPPPRPPPPAYNGPNHYEGGGGYSSSGRYQSPPPPERRRRVSRFTDAPYEYNASNHQQQQQHSSSSRGGHHHHHQQQQQQHHQHESFEGGYGGRGDGGYHHQHESYSSHSSYSRWA